MSRSPANRRIPEPFEFQRTRVCTGCGQTKPWAEFSPAKRGPDGRVVRVMSRCCVCEAESERLKRAQSRASREQTNGRERIPAPWEWVREKMCAGCDTRKPWALFSPAAYWPDGSVRCVQSRCRACRAERARGTERRTTPERVAYMADYGRRRRNALAADRLGRGRRLAKGRFVAWLERVASEEGGLAQLARDAGLHEDTLARVFSRNVFVLETTAEAALCARGMRLDDIYTDLEVAA